MNEYREKVREKKIDIQNGNMIEIFYLSGTKIERERKREGREGGRTKKDWGKTQLYIDEINCL